MLGQFGTESPYSQRAFSAFRLLDGHDLIAAIGVAAMDSNDHGMGQATGSKVTLSGSDKSDGCNQGVESVLAAKMPRATLTEILARVNADVNG